MRNAAPRGEDGSVAPAPPSERGDLLIADRFVAEHGADAMFVPGVGWYMWRDVWRACELGEHLELAKDTARAMIADEGADPASARSAQQEPRIRGALRLAEADPAIVVAARELDLSGHLLGTPEGTCDLRDGSLRPARREERITRLTACGVGPSVGEAWERFLARVQPEPEMRDFLQALTGAAIASGGIRLLPIFLGEGANGKTVFTTALTRVLGDYAYVAPLSLLMADPRRSSGPTPELAALRGRRLVSVCESPEDGRLSAERVKLLTGGDDITARYLHANPVTFRPTHTVLLATNHAPRVADAGPAIWDRLLLVRWPVRVPAAERVTDLGERLAYEEGPGILRWVVEGAVRFLREGLQVPEVVRQATEAYRASEDVFGAFLAECTVENSAAAVGAGDLLACYREWSKIRPAAPVLSDATLGERLAAKGYENIRRNRRSFWIGLRLLERGAE